ncbi:Sir2 histone deacetylase Hst2 [Lithohypha guttulata]|uniref:Sir2 histone deacetylase Hst2 n=1 Tax=Lithohypha guttulata TaxID=1690604 RepID=A0AAN7YAY7_9EURO|nr:Sir2 histone deacetylase Hst2 [Lithohypha guttulata]
MGNEASTPVSEDVPPITLKARTVEAVADYIKKNNVKRIVVMTGAGISTSAGIPDFRSPNTGLYANLARLNLPYAEAVFDISYFRNNPRPFYELAHELYPGKYRPTVTHSFISLLNKKGMLLKAFTQNIDCLEREAGVPGDKLVEAHGSFATQRCIDCGTEFPDDRMKDTVAIKEIPYCERTRCEGWRDELEELWETTNPSRSERKKQEAKPKDKQADLDARIEELTRGVDKTLKLSEDHQRQFEKDFAKRPDTGKLDVPAGLAKSVTAAEHKKQSEGEVNDRKSNGSDLSHIYPHLDSKSVDKPSL